ncbi:DUF2398 family protein [Streptomyces sp. TN58]|uniref:DUF2398 family protein n=1 Tax=Streptomyces sp. TN58 TaxID=234612 RepID=UPI002279007C|nr:DUF2398 family protein [Streptomyces sp. TN58]
MRDPRPHHPPARRVPHGRPGRGSPPADLERRVVELAAEHGGFWSKSAREPGAESELAEQAVARLAALGLVSRTADGVVPRPALARYAVGETVVLEPRTAAATQVPAQRKASAS